MSVLVSHGSTGKRQDPVRLMLCCGIACVHIKPTAAHMQAAKFALYNGAMEHCTVQACKPSRTSQRSASASTTATVMLK